jgi:hypothetical protein
LGRPPHYCTVPINEGGEVDVQIDEGIDLHFYQLPTSGSGSGSGSGGGGSSIVAVTIAIIIRITTTIATTTATAIGISCTPLPDLLLGLLLARAHRDRLLGPSRTERNTNTNPCWARQHPHRPP